MNDISQRYARFGGAVVDEISVHLNRHGNLTPLLRRLGVISPELLDSEHQHQTLQEVLRRYGPMFFLSVSKSDWTPDQVEKMRKNLDASVHTPLPGTLSVPESIRSASPAKQARTDPPPKPANAPPVSHPTDPSLSGTAARPTVPKYRSPYSLPARREHDTQPNGAAPAPSPSKSDKTIKTEDYEGPDRRVVRDRRSGTQDRRLSVEVVYRNRRFGGRERRKTTRRADDRQKSS